MKRSRITRIIGWTLAIVLAVVYGPSLANDVIQLVRWGPAGALGLSIEKALVQGHDVPSVVMLPWDASSNTRQDRNNCGPYSASAFLRIATGKAIVGSALVDRIPWRIWGSGTHPKDMERLLSSEGVAVRSIQTRTLNDEDKIRFLREQLAEMRPVILLVKMYGGGHYIVLSGYDLTKNVFYVYDPFVTAGQPGMTQDDNAEAPGNRTITEGDLLSAWSKGGFLRSFDWYGISEL